MLNRGPTVLLQQNTPQTRLGASARPFLCICRACTCQVQAACKEAAVPCGPIYSIKDWLDTKGFSGASLRSVLAIGSEMWLFGSCSVSVACDLVSCNWCNTRSPLVKEGVAVKI